MVLIIGILPTYWTNVGKNSKSIADIETEIETTWYWNHFRQDLSIKQGGQGRQTDAGHTCLVCSLWFSPWFFSSVDIRILAVEWPLLLMMQRVALESLIQNDLHITRDLRLHRRIKGFLLYFYFCRCFNSILRVLLNVKYIICYYLPKFLDSYFQLLIHCVQNARKQNPLPWAVYPLAHLSLPRYCYCFSQLPEYRC